MAGTPVVGLPLGVLAVKAAGSTAESGISLNEHDDDLPLNHPRQTDERLHQGTSSDGTVPAPSQSERARMRLLMSMVILCLLSLSGSGSGAERVLRIYDIVDLLDVPRDVPPPALGNSTVVTPDTRPAPLELPASERITPDVLLRTAFEAGLAALVAENSEWRSGHLLALNATTDLHEQVERTLAAARDRAQLQVRMNIKLVLMAPHLRLASFPLTRLDWQALPDQPGALFAELNQRDQDYVITNLRLNARPSKELDTTHYPFISVAAGQLGHAATITGLEYQPMSLAQGTVTARLALGDTVAVRGTPTPDRRYLTIEVEHRRCTLLERRTLDFGTSGTASMPIVAEAGERIRRSIPVGNALIIATGAYLEAKQVRCGYLIITPELRTSGAGTTPQVTIRAP